MKQLDVTNDQAVFTVFDEFANEFTTIGRVVVERRTRQGAPLGTGRHDANRETAVVNCLAALAQTEAAMRIFRAQKRVNWS